MTTRYARQAPPPSTLPLTGYFRPNYTSGVFPGINGDNWPGTASAGTSIAQTLNSEGLVLLQPGVPLNGRVPANMISTLATSAYFANSEAFSRYASPEAFSGWCVVDPDDTIYDSAPVLHTAYIVRDNVGYVGVRYNKVGVFIPGKSVTFHAFFAPGQQVFCEIPYVVTASHVPHILTFRKANDLLEVGINAPPGTQGGNTSVPFAHTIASQAFDPTDELFVGRASGNGMTGRLFEMGLSDQGLTNDQYGDTILWAQQEFDYPFLPPP